MVEIVLDGAEGLAAGSQEGQLLVVGEVLPADFCRERDEEVEVGEGEGRECVEGEGPGGAA